MFITRKYFILIYKIFLTRVMWDIMVKYKLLPATSLA